jgi:hypothetical protein
VPAGVALVEDAAGALGARYQGRACGSLGAMGCLSFHPRKIVTTGEGGAVTTNDAAIAEAVRELRHHGWRADDMPQPGFNYRLSDILCAVGIPQLRRLDELLAARTRTAAAYAERLRDLPVTLPGADAGDVHEHGLRAGERDDVRRRGERVRGDDHLVAGADPEREHGEVERGGAVRDGDRVLDAAGPRDELLELRHLRAHGQGARLEHPAHLLELGFPELREG